MMVTSSDLFWVQQVTTVKWDGYHYQTWSVSFELYVKAQRRCSNQTIIAHVMLVALSIWDNKALEEDNKQIKDDYGVITCLANSAQKGPTPLYSA